MARTTALPRSRTIATAAALMLLTIPLTACSATGMLGLGGNGASGGSSAEGGSASAGEVGSKCQVAAATIDGAIAEAKQSAPQLVADMTAGEPLDAGALVTPVMETIETASASITDPAVLTALEEARVEWTGLAGDVTALKAPDLSGLSEGNLGSIGEIQSYGEELSRLYSERLPALQETGARLQEACRAE